MMASERSTLALLLLGLLASAAQEEQEPARAFEAAAERQLGQLAEKAAELDALREEMRADLLPLDRELARLERELGEVRAEYDEAQRAEDARAVALDALVKEVERRAASATHLSSLLAEYARSFEARLHVVELRRYAAELEAARLAAEDGELSAAEVQAAQMEVLALSLERLHEALSGTRFEGRVVAPEGWVVEGTIALVGPLALFRSDDGARVGTAEQRLSSLEPALVEFRDPTLARAAAELVASGQGHMPFDATLGDAHAIAASKETLLEHVRKGGIVMVPILGMGALALVVALSKWLALTWTGRPRRRRVAAVLEAVGRHDREAAAEAAARVRGPIGRLLAAGVEHLEEPPELIEELLYERVLRARLKLNALLPFIAICAASAPLLGLLGTVTGIITTFEQITLFGTGDPKTLSGGISVALITTEFGLIVAIPSLLMHAFLSRKARRAVAEMEATAVAFVHEAGRSRYLRTGWLPRREEGAASTPSHPELVKHQVREALSDMLVPRGVAGSAR